MMGVKRIRFKTSGALRMLCPGAHISQHALCIFGLVCHLLGRLLGIWKVPEGGPEHWDQKARSLGVFCYMVFKERKREKNYISSICSAQLPRLGNRQRWRENALTRRRHWPCGRMTPVYRPFRIQVSWTGPRDYFSVRAYWFISRVQNSSTGENKPFNILC